MVYDETILTSSLDVDKSPWTLVTLRAQLAAAQGSGAKPMVVIGNSASSGAVRAQVMWQQASWGRAGDSTYPLDGGLANAGQKRYISGDVVLRCLYAASTLCSPVRLVDNGPKCGGF